MIKAKELRSKYIKKFSGVGFYNIQTMMDDGSAMVQFVDPETEVGSTTFRVTKAKLKKLREIADVRGPE